MPNRKYTPEFLKAEMAGWNSSIVLPHLSEEEKTIIRKRKLAIEMYSQGYPVKEIKERTSIGRGMLHKLLARCMRINDETGQPVGFSALLPYCRTEIRKGKMEEFIDEFEGLEAKLVEFYFSLNPKTPIKYPNKETAYSYFATCLMKEYGVGEEEYPFTLSDGGRRLFSKWLDKKEEEKQLYLARQKKDAKIEAKNTGPEGPMLRPSRPYEIVEIDGHRLDFIYAGIYYDENGIEHVVPAGRPWLLAAIDVATKCILSYRIVFSEEYDGMDVMKLIEGITLPYEDVSGVRDDGMPTQVFEEVRYAMPELILLDNALSHYSKDLTDKTSEYGYAFAFGPVADPTKRPNIERFFGVFETKWGHKVPSTTGSNPYDILRVKAETNAMEYRFTRDKVEMLLALAIAEYNNTPSKGLGGMTPIGRMRYLLNKGLFPSRLAPKRRDDFRLYCWRKAVFRGNKRTGKQIYVQTDNFIYTSDSIKNMYALAGQTAILKKDPDNIVVIHAFNAKGRYSRLWNS